MIELGKLQNLKVIRKTPIGAYLNEETPAGSPDILLPLSQVPNSICVGDEIEVFVYKDSKDRIISTIRKPKITLGEILSLKVVEITSIGAFLDWGLEKDLFLPFREQIGKIEKGNEYLIGLFIDSSNRICATMNIFNLLGSKSPYQIKDKVSGIIYSITKEMGAFVAVDNKYQGLIPNRELFGKHSQGEVVDARVINIRPDGKLELSLRKELYNEIESDAVKIIEKLKASGGSIPINDSSSPDHINNEMGMSKGAFKRAAGRLLKEGAILITETGIELVWKMEEEQNAKHS